MAHELHITDLVTSYPLNASVTSFYVREGGYVMRSAQPASTRPAAAGDDFASSPWEYQNVSETMDFVANAQTGGLSGGLAGLVAVTRILQAFLEGARQRQKTGMGPKVYLVVKFDSDTVYWRSEILTGSFSFPDPLGQLTRLTMDATLTFQRRYYFEYHGTGILTGYDPIALMLTSTEDTLATSVDAYTSDGSDLVATNWVQIPSSQVTGVLPAPVKLRIKNDSGSSISWREFYIANTVFSDPLTFDPFLQGSEAAGGATFAWSTTSEDVAWRWTPTVLTDARLADLAGRYYRLLAVIENGATAGVYLRASIEVWVSGAWVTQYSGGRIYYNGTDELIDLGAFPIPPGGYDPLGSDVAIRISVQKPEGGSSSMTLDFVQMTPTGDGLFQRIVQVGFAAPNLSAVVFDGIENNYYYDDVGVHRAILRPRGNPVLLWPNVNNRLRLLFREETGYFAARRMEISAFYRPRRLTL